MMADVIDLQAWKGKLSSSGKGGLKKNITNLMLFLQNVRELGNTVRWNEFAGRIEWNGVPLDDHRLVDIQMILEAHDFETNDKHLLPALIRHARDNAYHPVREYLRSLTWDGVPRLEHWLQQCLGAMDSPFVRTVGKRALIAAVARIFEPGCKVDTMLVLEGPQGLKKSSAVSSLFGEKWSAESVNLFDQHNKMVMTMAGAWAIELSEFVAIGGRGKNPGAVKGLISMKSDKVVLPYGKIATDHPRQCVFIGTINPDAFGYLDDDTGNRRYWPVRCTRINLDLIAAKRDQLWAEARHNYDAKVQWWLADDEETLAREQVASREESDIWEEVLTEKLVRAGISTTTVAAALQALGMPSERMGKSERNRAAKVLRQLGYVADDNPGKDDDGRSVRIFRRSP